MGEPLNKYQYDMLVRLKDEDIERLETENRRLRRALTEWGGERAVADALRDPDSADRKRKTQRQPAEIILAR